jgi:hypothetical protein
MGIKKQPEYVVVTAISSFRQRYVVPMEELQKLNPEQPVDPAWALDCVTCEEVKEFSQRHVGEQIIDAQVVKEAEILQFFDSDNDYLAGWEEGFKLEWIRNWKQNPSEEEKAEFNKAREKYGYPKIDTTNTFLED